MKGEMVVVAVAAVAGVADLRVGRRSERESAKKVRRQRVRL
jgi:hypothetical protein